MSIKTATITKSFEGINSLAAADVAEQVLNQTRRKDKALKERVTASTMVTLALAQSQTFQAIIAPFESYGDWAKSCHRLGLGNQGWAGDYIAGGANRMIDPYKDIDNRDLRFKKLQVAVVDAQGQRDMVTYHCGEAPLPDDGNIGFDDQKVWADYLAKLGVANDEVIGSVPLDSQYHGGKSWAIEAEGCEGKLVNGNYVSTGHSWHEKDDLDEWDGELYTTSEQGDVEEIETMSLDDYFDIELRADEKDTEVAATCTKCAQSGDCFGCGNFHELRNFTTTNGAVAPWEAEGSTLNHLAGHF